MTSHKRHGFAVGVLAVALLSVAASIAVAQDEPVSQPLNDQAAEGEQVARFALVIGNSDYEHLRRLPNAVRDATLVADTLKSIGFKVTPVSDANHQALSKALADFSNLVADHGPNSIALLYYSGHGAQDDFGETFLIPVDANIQRSNQISSSGISLDLVEKQFLYSTASLNILIFDACRNNEVPSALKDNGGGGLGALDKIPEGMLVAYATAPGHTASDGYGTNGPYAYALARLLKTPGLNLGELFGKLSDEVYRSTNKAQTPWFQGTDVSFTLVPKAPEPKSEPAPDTSVEIAFWNSVKDSRDPEDFRSYLDKFPNGNFAPLAKNRLQAFASAANANDNGTPPPAQSQPSPAAPAETAVGEPVAAVAQAGPTPTVPSAPPTDDQTAALGQTGSSSAPVEQPETGDAAACTIDDNVPMSRVIRACRRLLDLSDTLDPKVAASYHAAYGRALRRSYVPDAALAQLEKAIQLNPDGAAAYLEIGYIWDEVWTDRAPKAYAKAVQVHPQSAEALDGLAYADHYVGKTDDASKYYKLAIAADPEWAPAYLGLSDLLAKKSPKDAAKNLDKGLQILRSTSRTGLLMDGALRLLDFKKNQDAASIFRRLVDLAPIHPTASLNLAVALERSGDFAEAERAYTAALKLDPDNPRFHVSFGAYLENRGQHAAALDQFKSASALQPLSFRVALEIGYALKSDKPEEALPYFEKSVTLATGDWAFLALYGLGNCLEDLERYGESLDAYRKASDIVPDDSYTLGGIGNALYELNRYDEAIAPLQAAIKLNPKYTFAHNSLGRVLGMLGRPEDGLKEFRTALKLDPKNRWAMRGIGDELLDLGQAQEAMQNFQAALKIDPTDSYAGNGVGRSYYALNDFEHAVGAYQKVVAKDPKSTDAWDYMGDSLHQLSRYQEARDAFSKALGIDPKDSYALASRGFESLALDELESAKSDLEQAVGMRNDVAWYHNWLGSAYLALGSADAALAEADRAQSLDSSKQPWIRFEIYYACGRFDLAKQVFSEKGNRPWYDDLLDAMIDRREGNTAGAITEINDRLGSVEGDDQLKALKDYVNGDIGADSLIKSLQSSQDASVASRYAFLAGEWALIGGDQGEASKLYSSLQPVDHSWELAAIHSFRLRNISKP